MAQNAGSIQSTSKLLQIAGFLTIADRLVRDRKYAQAFEQIAKALSIDPTNLYTKAHAERLRLLVSASDENTNLRSDNPNPDFFPRSFSQFLASNFHSAQERSGRASDDRVGERTRSNRYANSSDSGFGSTRHFAEKSYAESDDNRFDVGRSLTHANALLRERRYDEALNSLAPAILVDPLNSELLILQKQIRQKRKEDEANRLRPEQREQHALNDEFDTRKLAIQEYISLAVKLADAEHFLEALTTLGRGYLFDPLNEDLTTYERLILKTMQWKTEHEENTNPAKGGVPTNPFAKQQLIEHLDKAQELLERDQFGAALSHVALAMMAAPNPGTVDLHSSLVADSMEENSPSLPSPSMRTPNVDNATNEISGRIQNRLKEAELMMGRGNFEKATTILLHAAAMIPADGSLADLDRIISRRFMEYSVLLRAATVRETKDDTTQAAKGRRESAIEAVRKESISQPPPKRMELSPQFPPFPSDREPETDDESFSPWHSRMRATQDCILECLKHLNAEKLKEASALADAAVSLDDSRLDVRTFAERVADLEHKVGNRVVLKSSLLGSCESVRQQAKDLLYKLFREQLVIGIDKGLELLPGNELLLTRKAEVAESQEEYDLSLAALAKRNDTAAESPSKMSVASRKTKKSPQEQIDMPFSNDVGRRAAQGWS